MPLARHKADFTIVQGCSNKFSNEAHWGSTFWLTGANRYSEPGRSFCNSISVDQVAAAHLGRETRFSSIQLGTPDANNQGHGPGLSLAWDEHGKPLAGFTPEQCQVQRTNATYATVAWQGKNDLSTLRGREVRLSFTGSRSKLYSFFFEASPASAK